jgi:hypothetical protein
MGSERHILRLAMNWINKIFSGFSSQKAPSTTNPLVMILKMVNTTREVEYSCDEVYALIDQYAELVKNGEDAEDLMPLIKQHLDMCPDCQEDYNALMEIVAAMQS